MAAKPRTPAEREAGNGSFVAREKAETRTRCRVWKDKCSVSNGHWFCFSLCVFFLLFLLKLKLLHDADIFYPGIEVGGNLAQADGGVATDRALFVSGLQSCEVTHQILVQVGLVQFRSQQQHGLKQERTQKLKKKKLTAGKTVTRE